MALAELAVAVVIFDDGVTNWLVSSSATGTTGSTGNADGDETNTTGFSGARWLAEAFRTIGFAAIASDIGGAAGTARVDGLGRSPALAALGLVTAATTSVELVDMRLNDASSSSTYTGKADTRRGTDAAGC